MKNVRVLKEYLLTKIEKDNPVQLEKVERYINLLLIFYKLDENIKEHGTMVETVNATQTFLKANPAVAEKNKINGSLLALEKSFGFGKNEIELDKPSDDFV